MIDSRADGKVPGVVGFFPAMTIERSEPAVAVTGMTLAPGIELRPFPIQQPRRMPGSGGMIANRRRMAETGYHPAGEAVAIGIRPDGAAGDLDFRDFRTGSRATSRTDRDVEMSGS